VIGGGGLALPMTGSLPPDLQGTLFRAGPAWPWGGRDGGAQRGEEAGAQGDDVGAGDDESAGVSEGGEAPVGALHAVEFRDGQAVWYVRRESTADANLFWHAGSILALPEAGIPLQYSRFLEPEEFAGGLTVPIASHAHRVAADGSRVLFAVDDGSGTGAAGFGDAEGGVFLRLGEWDAAGALRSARSVELERATWQHDIGVTAKHVVFIESPTARLVGAGRDARVPYGWLPGAEGWIGVVPRGDDGPPAKANADGTAPDGSSPARPVRWIRLDPCVVTHVLGAYDEPDGGIVLYVCRYGAPEAGQPVDTSVSVVAPAGLGLSAVGGTLGVLERWRVQGDRLERRQVDERSVEYPRIDAACEGAPFRYGYALEIAWADAPAGSGAGPGVHPDPWTRESSPVGLLQFDTARDEIASWVPGPGCRPSEPVFVRAADGRSDDEGWLLTLVDDPNRGGSDIYVLDASSLGRRRPEAVVHLPARLPVRSHGEWVPADRYR
jgi:carotenoid cleavage dioxygenase-like enzyme